ncbi:MAG: transglycosylase SLT domain-containing protein [Psychromonas sp.]
MKIIILTLSLFFFPLLTFANDLNIEQQRKLYAEATELQKQGNWQEAQKLAEKIPDYPLKYFLEYQSINNNLDESSASQVKSFIRNNPDRAVRFDLERNYLAYLSENERWDEFLTFYPSLPNSTNLKCFHFEAKMEQGLSEQIWPEVKKVWLTGSSLPNACDNVLSLYKDNNKITEQLVWQRFELAFNKNSHSLMRYLITLMNDKNEALATQLYRLNQNPETLLDRKLFENREQASFSFLLTSLKRLARKDPVLAINAFNELDKKIPLTATEQIEVQRYIAFRVMLENEDELMPWLDEVLVSLKDDSLIELRIRYAIKYDNWQDIEHWLSKLSKPISQQDRWVYWQARVLEENNKQKQANKLYQKISGKRSYYSFLAAQKVGLDYQLNAKIVSEKTDSLAAMGSELAHIEELLIQDHKDLLKREWRRLLNKNSKQIQLQLGYYAKQKDWVHLSILASINSKSWDAINIRFPEVKANFFANIAEEFQLSPSYIYAITRQESAFDEYAKSRVGASGYMQLMPATAKETASKIGMDSYKRKSQLNDGKVNVHLGSAYFDMLLKRYDGNRIIATAAYNAGPNRVDRWQSSKKGRAEHPLKMDSWIETIPYKETRHYVQNVLAYNVIYQYVLLDKSSEFFNEKELTARF